MDEKLLFMLFQFYLLKKRTVQRDMAHLRLQFQRLRSTHRRTLARRKKFLLYLVFLTDHSNRLNPRTVWSVKKNDAWWSTIVPVMDDRQLKENFRLQKSTFAQLIKQVGPHLRRNDTILRRAVPVEKRIACALYALGSTSELRTVANLFGLGKSTTGELLHEFCSTIVDVFFHRLVKFPSSDQEIVDTIHDFLVRYDYPMCIGSVDGTHISVKAPVESQVDYFNYKKFHSIVMLASVNCSLQFTYVNVGAPGRCNDSSVYSGSNLAEVIQHPIYSKHFTVINGVKVQAHLIADSAFALNTTLMKPYATKPNMPRHHGLFNYRLSRCRSTVERAFGALKNRFRCLHKKMEFDLHHVVTLIKTAVVLHNLCIAHGDGVEVEWDSPQTIYHKAACNVHTIAGNGIREALTDYFLQNPL